MSQNFLSLDALFWQNNKLEYLIKFPHNYYPLSNSLNPSKKWNFSDSSKVFFTLYLKFTLPSTNTLSNFSDSSKFFTVLLFTLYWRQAQIPYQTSRQTGSVDQGHFPSGIANQSPFTNDSFIKIFPWKITFWCVEKTFVIGFIFYSIFTNYFRRLHQKNNRILIKWAQNSRYNAHQH